MKTTLLNKPATLLLIVEVETGTAETGCDWLLLQTESKKYLFKGSRHGGIYMETSGTKKLKCAIERWHEEHILIDVAVR